VCDLENLKNEKGHDPRWVAATMKKKIDLSESLSHQRYQEQQAQVRHGAKQKNWGFILWWQFVHVYK
jgi:hypothetical protein